MIALDRMGSFFVAGRQIAVTGQPTRWVSYSHNVTTEYDPNGTFAIEHAYVQYFLPERPRFKTPVILVHGGGLTGVMWEDTPDGRPGWLTRLLEARIATYVIDNVERGRAGWCAIKGQWPDEPVVRSDEEASRFYRFGFAGHQFPIEAMRYLGAQTVPRWPSTSALQAAALAATIERIGPSILLGFSQGGGLSFQAADRQRDNVRACITIEPHGIPTSFTPGLPGTPVLMVLGDFIEQDDYWRDMAQRGRGSLTAWGKAGGRADIWDLPSFGIRGNTHMMMMDRNGDEIVERLIGWLDQRFQERSFV